MSWLFSLMGLLLAAAAVPLLLRWVPPNSLYGLRTEDSLSSPEVWYESNALAGRDLLTVGIAMAVGSWLLRWIPALSGVPYDAICSVGLFIMVVATAVRGAYRARAIAGQINTDDKSTFSRRP